MNNHRVDRYELPPIPGRASTREIVIRIIGYAIMLAVSLGTILIMALATANFIGYPGQFP